MLAKLVFVRGYYLDLLTNTQPDNQLVLSAAKSAVMLILFRQCCLVLRNLLS